MTFQELFKSISGGEWRLVFLMAGLMIILTSLPYLMGLIIAPAGTVYDGLHSFHPADFLVYYSYLEQAKEGHFLFKDLYTSEKQSLGMLNVFWLAIGLLAKLFKMSNALAFHLSRIILIPPAVAAFYLTIAYFLNKEQWRKTAFFLLLLAAGWGVFALSLANDHNKLFYSIDLWVPESSAFLVLHHSPHFIASLSLIFLIFLFALLAGDNNKFRYSFLAGLLALILFQFHPYHFPVIFGVLFFYWLVNVIRDKKINWLMMAHFLIIFLLSLPSLLYHFWLVQTEPMIGLRAMQNITPTPPFLFVVVGCGLLFFLAVLGIIKIYLDRDSDFNSNLNQPLFLVCWLVVGLILVYSPITFQRRLLEGWQLPMVILATAALISLSQNKFIDDWFKYLKQNKYFISVGFLLFFCLSNFFHLIRDAVYFYYQKPLTRENFFLPKNDLAAFNWLKTTTPPDSIILSSYFTGRFIPAYAGRAVYLGHAHETIFYKSKEQEVNLFFKDNENDNYCQNFLKKTGIDYLYYGPRERKAGSFEPADKDYLIKVYNNGEIEIYQVANL